MPHSQSLKLESSADAEKLITGDLFWSSEDHGKERMAVRIESVKLFVGFISVATSECFGYAKNRTRRDTLVSPRAKNNSSGIVGDILFLFTIDNEPLAGRHLKQIPLDHQVEFPEFNCGAVARAGKIFHDKESVP